MNVIFHILGKSSQQDFHIVQRGRYTTNQLNNYSTPRRCSLKCLLLSVACDGSFWADWPTLVCHQQVAGMQNDKNAQGGQSWHPRAAQRQRLTDLVILGLILLRAIDQLQFVINKWLACKMIKMHKVGNHGSHGLLSVKGWLIASWSSWGWSFWGFFPQSAALSIVLVWYFLACFLGVQFIMTNGFMVDISIWMKYELMTSTFSGMLISKGNHPHLAASSSYVQVREYCSDYQVDLEI